MRIHYVMKLWNERMVPLLQETNPNRQWLRMTTFGRGHNLAAIIGAGTEGHGRDGLRDEAWNYFQVQFHRMVFDWLAEAMDYCQLSTVSLIIDWLYCQDADKEGHDMNYLHRMLEKLFSNPDYFLVKVTQPGAQLHMVRYMVGIMDYINLRADYIDWDRLPYYLDLWSLTIVALDQELNPDDYPEEVDLENHIDHNYIDADVKAWMEAS